MKKLFIVLLLAAAVYACNQMDDGVSDGPPSNFPITFCDSGNGSSPCSYLPYEVGVDQGFGYTSFLDSATQPHFDIFSWQTFIALNWPADSTGRPVGGGIGDNTGYQRVWEYYQDPAQVFSVAVANSAQPLTLHLNAARAEGLKFLYMDSKAPGVLDSMHGFREADGHPLIDVNLNFALYEIRMNPVEATFVTTHNLTTVAGIDSFAKKNNNQFELPESDSAAGSHGMIEVKAAWRILDSTKGDDYSRYYTRDAIIYIDSAHVVNNKQLKFKAKVGLVGMHIIRKTSSFAQKMIWSTFEHIDNTPDNMQEAQMKQKRWSFYSPECLNCVPNDTPVYQQGDKAYRWDSTAPWAKRYAVNPPSQSNVGPLFGTQAVRVYPVYKFTEQVNNAWRAKLKGTVWANYRLIGSQWQKGETIHPNAPAFLANTTLETYIQPSASCISCHGDFAYILSGKDTIRTDMSFIFPVFAR